MRSGVFTVVQADGIQLCDVASARLIKGVQRHLHTLTDVAAVARATRNHSEDDHEQRYGCQHSDDGPDNV